MGFVFIIFVVSGIAFAIKLAMALGRHGVDGMKDSIQRAKEGKPEIRAWYEDDLHEDDVGTDMRFCPYCGAKRTTDVCGSCGRA